MVGAAAMSCSENVQNPKQLHGNIIIQYECRTCNFVWWVCLSEHVHFLLKDGMNEVAVIVT